MNEAVIGRKDSSVRQPSAAAAPARAAAVADVAISGDGTWERSCCARAKRPPQHQMTCTHWDMQEDRTECFATTDGGARREQGSVRRASRVHSRGADRRYAREPTGAADAARVSAPETAASPSRAGRGWVPPAADARGARVRRAAAAHHGSPAVHPRPLRRQNNAERHARASPTSAADANHARARASAHEEPVRDGAGARVRGHKHRGGCRVRGEVGGARGGAAASRVCGPGDGRAR